MVPCCAMSASTQVPTAKHDSITSLTTKQLSLCMLRLDLFLVFNHVQSRRVHGTGKLYLSTIKPSNIEHFMCITVNIPFVPWIRHGNQSWILCEIKRSILWGPRFCQFRQLEEVPKCSLCGGPRVFECQVHWCWWRERFGQFGMENILEFDYVVSGSIMSCIVLPCKGSKLIYIFEESG